MACNGPRLSKRQRRTDNASMTKALAAKGYHYQFVFSRNAGHVDRGTKAETLPEALEYVWQGYPIK